MSKVKTNYIDIIYLGAKILGTTQPFRIVTQVMNYSGVIEPFWAQNEYKSIFEGRFNKVTKPIALRFAIEPNSDVYMVDGSIRQIYLPVIQSMSGNIWCEPITIQTTESLVGYHKPISMQVGFAWYVY